MKFTSIALGLLAASLTLHAETRSWRNADASASFVGDYVSHDEGAVTIRRKDGRVFTLELTKLHQEDRVWLMRRGPAAGGKDVPAPDPNAVFDSLCFGDDRKEVTRKLQASELVETDLDETFFGRFGLNGTFRTKQKIGGLHCELFFDWTEGGGLREISLQTQGLGRGAYDDQLQSNWKELAKLLTMLHGKPVQNGDYPDLANLKNDLFLASHIWHLKQGGSALLGSSMQEGKYQVIVRFTTEHIEPVRVP